MMIFYTLDVAEVSLRINGHPESAEDIKLNFKHTTVARAYHRIMSFMGRDLNVDTALQKDVKTLYPIYYFSLEHLDLYTQSVVDIYFRANVGIFPAGAVGPSVVPAGFRAIAVMLRDNAVLFESVVGRMRVANAPVENM